METKTQHRYGHASVAVLRFGFRLCIAVFDFWAEQKCAAGELKMRFEPPQGNNCTEWITAVSAAGELRSMWRLRRQNTRIPEYLTIPGLFDGASKSEPA